MNPDEAARIRAEVDRHAEPATLAALVWLYLNPRDASEERFLRDAARLRARARLGRRSADGRRLSERTGGTR